MKPECKLCKEKDEGLTSIFGKEFTDQLVYNLFNLDMVSREKYLKDLQDEQLIQMYLDYIESEEERNRQRLERYMRWFGIDSQQIMEYLKNKEAWNELIEKIRKGEIKPSEISPEALLQNFPGQVTEELAKEDLVNVKVYTYRMYPQLLFVYPEFTEKSEKIIARKVLEEAFLNLRKQGFGIHEVKDSGIGIYPSHVLCDYDEYQHTYDMIDIQESLINTARRDPKNLEISDDDLKARIPIHSAKSSNVILIDSSYSMRGVKFRGGIMAALALKELLQTEYKDDRLFVVAYNHKPQMLLPGEIVKLKPYGYTDIGQALDFSVNLLMREDGNRNIFLITDGEPTASYIRNQTPEESAYRAAYMAGKFDIRLNIIMLDYRVELKIICEKMARLNGNATVTHVRNPLNLKEFIIKTFVDRKRFKD